MQKTIQTFDLHPFKLNKLQKRKTLRNLILDQNNTYIDKSTILQLIVQNTHQILIFNFPAKWGKSLNFELIYRFFNIEKDSTEIQFNNLLFYGNDGNHQKRDGLQIYRKNKQFCNQYQSKIPVLSINLENIIFTKEIDFRKQLYLLIIKKYYQLCNIYKKQSFLFSENLFSQMQEQNFITTNQQIIKLFIKLIQNLQQQQSTHKCYILIDNFSIIIQKMIFFNFSYQTIKSTANLLTELCKKVVQNQNQRKIIIFGTINIINNWDESMILYDLTNLEYSQLFGLTQSELQKNVFQQIGFNEINIIDTIKKYYGGYLVQQNNQKNEKSKIKQLFHPFASIQYILECKKQNKALPGKIYQIFNQNNLFNFLLLNSFKDLQFILNLVNILSGSQIQDNANKLTQIVQFPSHDENIIEKTLKQVYKQNKQKIRSFIAYLLVSFGIVTGDILKISNEIYLYLPNKLMLNILMEQVKKQFQNEDYIKNFSEIDIQDKDDFKYAIQQSISKWITTMPSINQFDFHCMVYIRYSLSKNPTHKPFVEQICKNGKINGELDNAFYPFKQSKSGNRGYVHEYKLGINKNKYKQMQLNEKMHNQNFAQIICKGYLNWMIKKSFISEIKIKQIVLRSIIFNNDENKYYLCIEQITFSIQESLKIQKFFALQEIQNCIMQHKQKDDQMLIQILKLCRFDEFKQLLKHIISLKQQQINIFFKRKQFIKLTQNNFNLYQLQLVYPLLKKLNLNLFEIDKLFKYTSEQLRSVSSLTIYQANEVWNQLQQLKDITKFLLVVEQPNKD